MAYTTRADLEQRFKVEEIEQLVEDDAALADVTADAAAKIDGYLGLYVLPLPEPVPSLLVHLSCEITRYLLWDDRAPAEVRRRYEDALAMLRDIAKGTLKLPGTVDVPLPLSDPGIIAHTTRERTFSDETLGAFVGSGGFDWPPRTS